MKKKKSKSTVQEFQRDLQQLLNRHSVEQTCNTPDFVLAQYLVGCLKVWCEALGERDGFWAKRAVSCFRLLKPNGPVTPNARP